MKKGFLAIGVSLLVVISVGFWLFNSSVSLKSVDLLQLLIIVLLIGFGVFFGIKRLRSAKRGEPVEDELSKKQLQKASSISYYFSLYWWVFLLYIKDKVVLDTEELIGMGVIGMGVLLVLSWIILRFKGIRNE